jgi:glycosyltransferase involved in cell wall biosynthesis
MKTARIVSSERCGLVVEERARDLEDAIEMISNDREAGEEMGRKGRFAIEARHPWRNRADSLISALKSND